MGLVLLAVFLVIAVGAIYFLIERAPFIADEFKAIAKWVLLVALVLCLLGVLYQLVIVSWPPLHWLR